MISEIFHVLFENLSIIIYIILNIIKLVQILTANSISQGVGEILKKTVSILIPVYVYLLSLSLLY